MDSYGKCRSNVASSGHLVYDILSGIQGYFNGPTLPSFLVLEGTVVVMQTENQKKNENQQHHGMSTMS